MSLTTKASSFSTTMLPETLYSAGEDEPDHRFDQYVINFNVKGTITEPQNGKTPTITLDMTSGTQIGQILAGFLQEIANSQPVTIDDPNVKAIVTGAIDTPEKAAELLALDPFFTGEDITQNPARYAPFFPDGLVSFDGSPTNIVEEIPHPTGTSSDGTSPGIETARFVSTTAMGTGQVTGPATTASYGGTFTVGGVSGRDTYTVTQSLVAAKTTTNSITLGSDNGIDGSVALYRDMMFGSFLTLQTLTKCVLEPNR